MTEPQDFQDRGEALRQSLGIDGTAGDAQDVRHGYVQDSLHTWCLACGLSELATVHRVTRHAFTPDEIEAGIVRAIHDRELEIVPSLVRLLALQDPARAQAVLDTVELARKLTRKLTRSEATT